LPTLVLLLPVAAYAASDWKATTGLNLTELYSDNISLVAGGGKSSFVTEVSPHIGLSRQGARGSVNIAYSLNDLLYNHDIGHNNLSNDLNASMQLEPVLGVVHVNGNARVAQQYASQFGPTSADTFHTVANRVETRSVSLTPSLHDEFFERQLITDASLGLNYASSDSGTLGTSTSNTLALSLRSGPKVQQWSWSAAYNRNGADSNGAATTVLESESYNIGYAIAPRTKIFLAGGSNSSQAVTSLQGLGSRYTTGGVAWGPTKFLTLTATGGQSGGAASYGLSADWAPSPRIRLDATAGRRNNAAAYNLSGNWVPSALTSISGTAQKNFDGGTFGVGSSTTGLSNYGFSSYALNLNQRMRRAVFGLSYTESVVDASQQLNQQVTFPFYFCAGGTFKPVVAGESMPAGCTPVLVQIPFTQILNQTTFDKTWAGTLSYALPKGSLGLTLTQSRRQFISTAGGGTDRSTAVSANWSLPLSSRTSTSLGMTRSTAVAEPNQQSDSWSLYWSLAHQVSPHVTSSLNARHSEQNTNGTTGSIKENTVSAQLVMTF